MNSVICPKCRCPLREESRKWGTVLICKCGWAKEGTISQFAKTQMNMKPLLDGTSDERVEFMVFGRSG